MKEGRRQCCAVSLVGINRRDIAIDHLSDRNNRNDMARRDVDGTRCEYPAQMKPVVSSTAKLGLLSRFILVYVCMTRVHYLGSLACAKVKAYLEDTASCLLT